MTTGSMTKIAMLLLCCFALFACKKDSKSDERKTLIVGRWQMTALTESPPQSDLDGDGVNDANIYEMFDDCEKQAIFEFKADGAYVEDYTSCGGTGNDFTSTWSMNDAQTVLTISGQPLDIKELSVNRMTVSFTSDEDGTQVTQTAIYVKK